MGLCVAWPEGASSREVLSAIHVAVQEGFGLLLAQSRLVLQYRDDDGDMCSLVEATLEDCLSFTRDGVMKLTVLEPSVAPCLTVSAPTAIMLESNLNLPVLSHDLEEQAAETVHELVFQIATPPATPRDVAPGLASSDTIDEEYDSAWSLI